MALERPAAGRKPPPLLRRLLARQFVRFVAVGLVNTAFGYAVYALMLFAGLHFAAANGVALLAGIAFSFTTQRRLVFRDRRTSRFGRFVACWAVVFLFNIGLIALLVHAGSSAYVAGAVALVPVTLLSYAAQKFVVFRADGVAVAARGASSPSG